MNNKKTSRDTNQNIKVYVRCRPINEQEHANRNGMCIDVCETRKTITVKTHHDKTFTFDGTFGSTSTQIDVYGSVVQPLIQEVLQGYNCTVFAYGQTGTGKTYTMEGVRSEELLSWQHDPHVGIVPRALHQIFSHLPDPEAGIIKVSFLELYNEELFDLLGSGDTTVGKMKIFEDSSNKGTVLVKGLEEVTVRSREEVYSLLQRGASRRQVAATLMNASSSRSHTIFTITVITRDVREDSGEELLRTGKLNLVDLAGSENIGRSGAIDKRAREAGNINQSLLTLGRVITALVERTPHVPYRESKLTRLLQDSLGGRTKTSIIATISPASCNVEETLSTLDYAFRAKNITNRPEVNMKVAKEIVLKHMTDELERLRRDLQASREKNGIYIDEANFKDMQARLDLQSEELQKKAGEIETFLSQIEAQQKKIDEINGLFNEAQEILAKEVSRKEQVEERLKEVNLSYTRAKAMINAQVTTEARLQNEARKLYKTAQIAAADVQKLHMKVDRSRDVEQHNHEKLQQLKACVSAFIDSSHRGTSETTQILKSISSLGSLTIDHVVEQREQLLEMNCLLSKLLYENLDHLETNERIVNDLNEQFSILSSNEDKVRRQITSSIEPLFVEIKNELTHNLFSRLQSERMSVLTNIRDNLSQITSFMSSIDSMCTSLSVAANTMCSEVQEKADVLSNAVECQRSKRQEGRDRKDQKLKNIGDIMEQMKRLFETGLHELETFRQEDSRDYHEVQKFNQEISSFTSHLNTDMKTYEDKVSHCIKEGRELLTCANGHVENTHVIMKQYEDVCTKSEKASSGEVDQQLAQCNDIVQHGVKALEEINKDVAKTVKSSTAALKDNIKGSKQMSASRISHVASTISMANDQVSIVSENLKELKDSVTAIVQEVKVVPVTGLTPVKGKYNIPNKLTKSISYDLLKSKFDAKLAGASLEQRAALEEGDSLSLDVTLQDDLLSISVDDLGKEN